MGSRAIVVGAGQLGPVEPEHSRADVVERLIALLRAGRRARLPTRRLPGAGADDVLPPLVRRRPQPSATTTTSRRCRARRRGRCSTRRSGSASASVSGYAELTEPDSDGSRHRYNSQVLVERDGSIVATYRKVHLPGHDEDEPDRPFQHAERYYFEPGPDEFGVWDAFGGRVGMMICNDRRWPESYRVMGLQGVELILCGYNTPIHYVPDPSQDILQGFHNALVMQSGAYQNGTWVVGVAKGGVEAGVDSLAQSMIVAPSGQIVAQALTAGDELITRRLRPRLVQALHAARCSTSTATAVPRCTPGSRPNAARCRRAEEVRRGQRAHSFASHGELGMGSPSTTRTSRWNAKSDLSGENFPG